MSTLPRLYIAGPMTGVRDYNYPAFRAAEETLKSAGYEVVSPAGELVDGWTWERYMRRALRQLLDCDGVALLDGWWNSRGAALERHVAQTISMPVATVVTWRGLAEADQAV